MTSASIPLFSEFDSTSKEQWLKRVEKDLKGGSLPNLDWQLPDLTISPLAHADDFKGSLLAPIASANAEKNRWNIVANIWVKNEDVKSANKEALAVLMGGANALCFVVDDFLSENELNILLENIELDYISIFFAEETANKNPLSFLKSFCDLAKLKGNNLEILRGGIHYDPFVDGRHDVKATIELLSWVHEHLPKFKVLIINGSSVFNGSENVISELLATIQGAEKYLNKLTNKGLSIEIIKHHLAFNCTIGLSYFVEIAKLRALKLLWGNILDAYNTNPILPTIYAQISTATQTDDANINKIRATTQAMSAVIAGVEGLTIDVDKPATDNEGIFHKRIALNINHLLQLESHLHQVQDPAAGSYYIEQLTQQIAEKTWERFRNL